jgi:hypothetical protein
VQARKTSADGKANRNRRQGYVEPDPEISHTARKDTMHSFALYAILAARPAVPRILFAATAAQLFAAADSRPFVGPGLKPLVLRRFRCQLGRHVKAASG